MNIGDRVRVVAGPYRGAEYTVDWECKNSASVHDFKGEQFVFDKEYLEVISEEFTKDDYKDFQLAWQSVWTAICEHAPEDLWLGISNTGSGIENAVEFVEMMSKFYKENVGQASALDLIKTFTMNYKNLEISFEDGMITLRDWDVRLNQPMDYRCDTSEQLEELMGAWEVICKFKMEVEE